MSARKPVVQSRRASPCLAPRPAREMSGRGFALVLAIYAVLFAAAALRLWLTGGAPQ